jgi:hypothetical protein
MHASFKCPLPTATAVPTHDTRLQHDSTMTQMLLHHPHARHPGRTARPRSFKPFDAATKQLLGRAWRSAPAPGARRLPVARSTDDDTKVRTCFADSFATGCPAPEPDKVTKSAMQPPVTASDSASSSSTPPTPAPAPAAAADGQTNAQKILAGARALQGEDQPLQISREVIEKMKYTVFGLDTLFVTSVENYEADGVVFKGNLRAKDPGAAYLKMKSRLRVRPRWLSAPHVASASLV